MSRNQQGLEPMFRKIYGIPFGVFCGLMFFISYDMWFGKASSGSPATTASSYEMYALFSTAETLKVMSSM